MKAEKEAQAKLADSCRQGHEGTLMAVQRYKNSGKHIHLANFTIHFKVVHKY